MHFRIITWNIHKGIGGVDRRYRPERIIEILANYDPDVVMLQEVDEGVPRSRRHRQVDLIGDALELPHRAFQANVFLREGHYGNAILSRFPILEAEDIDLTVPFKKRRRALVARCRVRLDAHHTRTLLVMNLHLGLAGYERTIQLRRLLAHEVLSHVHHTTPTVAGGDFNDVWGTLGRRLLEPFGFRPASRPILTFPAIRPFRPLDRLYYRGTLEVQHCFASRSRLARVASDHLPMVADFQFTSASRSEPE